MRSILQNNPKQYTGVETSASAFAAAQAVIVDERVDLTSNLPQADVGEIDVVFMSNVIEHIENDIAFFRRCCHCSWMKGRLS